VRSSEACKVIEKPDFRLVARKASENEREFNADRSALAIAWQTDHACLAQNCKIFATHSGGSKVKTLRQISAATILSLALAVCVFAGQIESWGVVEPPPPPPSSTAQTTGTATAIVLTVLSLIYP
jgi:hypothetical protein